MVKLLPPTLLGLFQGAVRHASHFWLESTVRNSASRSQSPCSWSRAPAPVGSGQPAAWHAGDRCVLHRGILPEGILWSGAREEAAGAPFIGDWGGDRDVQKASVVGEAGLKGPAVCVAFELPGRLWCTRVSAHAATSKATPQP